MDQRPVPADQPVALALTEPELAALRALAAGIGALTGRDVSASDAVVAVLDVGLVRLTEDFEIPDEAARAQVEGALAALRGSWIRGDTCL